MKAETKFNLGDKVYFLTAGKIHFSFIDGINIGINKGHTNISYNLRDNPAGSQYTKQFSESDVAESPNALLPSLMI